MCSFKLQVVACSKNTLEIVKPHLQRSPRQNRRAAGRPISVTRFSKIADACLAGANIKSALKSGSRERQYVSRPGIVSCEMLRPNASTKRLKFIVHDGGQRSPRSMRSWERAKWEPRAQKTRLSPPPLAVELDEHPSTSWHDSNEIG